MAKLTRRNFLAGSALAAAAAGLAACNQSGVPADGSVESDDGSTAPAGDLTAPDASAYPIDPDAEGTEALWTSEKTRDGWTKITNPEGAPELGIMDASKIIQVGGLAFKDLNGNGKLDFYEDWRQDGDARAAALASMMSGEDIIPMLFHGGISNDLTSTDTENFDLIEQGSCSGVSRLTYSLDSFASDVAWINNVQAVGEGTAYGIPYINTRDPAQLFNIPASVGLAATFDKEIWRKAGMWQARAWRAMGITCELGPQIDLYTQLRGTRLNGAVGNDPALNRDFAAAFGGGMQSTWGDDEATDDQGWGKDSVGVMLKHFVGEGSNEGGVDDHLDYGKWNVFPGGQFKAHLVPFLDGGMHLDSSTEQMVAVMPCYGVAYDPNDPNGLGEWVGAGFSEYLLSGLRNTGWDGMLCTDWIIANGCGHGVKDLTVAERLKKIYSAGCDQHGGTFDPENGSIAWQALVDEVGEEEATAQYQEHARHILKLMNKLGLFNNPYSDRSAAKAMLENEAAAAFGIDAATKSVVMLKNDGVITSAGLDGKVYIPRKYVPEIIDPWFGNNIPPTAEPYLPLEAFGGNAVTDELDESGELSEASITKLADFSDVKYAVIKVSNPQDAYQGVEGGEDLMSIVYGTEAQPGPYFKPISLQYRPYTADGPNVRKISLNPDADTDNRSRFGESTFANNESDLDAVIALKESLPEGAKLILIVDADRPMCFGEIEPYADAILLGFVSSENGGIADQAYANIITGAAEPYGLLSHPMPKDMDAVEALNEDTPRSVECYTDAMGNTYEFAFGLNWSGVIDDERTATYKAAPLTEPQLEQWNPTV
ncbi:MAG: twin-arginine translocation signal domain-containing protein [Atopobiaceae bacterium]|nr:twin-arginine translocation signal domain-containing protein [Atopobiaceae bacterium]